MKNKTYVGNAALIINGRLGWSNAHILLGRKKPENKADLKRSRKRVGIGRWVPPGGTTEPSDKSQRHSVQREALQETGLGFPLEAFKKVAILRSYIDGARVPEWLVHIYLVRAMSSQRALIVPNEEYADMRWFRLAELPFESMLRGDRIWLPRLAKGEKLSIQVIDNRNLDGTFTVIIGPLD